ncbi:MAG TPA: hypothetical protein VGS20_15890 [Candidatus Acidoferrales bacterium]|nr:hypothetical protein [Candidatus Acidoferrales bacterium]
MALAGPQRSPTVIERSRIEIVERGIPPQPYHAAAKLDSEAAEKLIRRSMDAAQRLAEQAIAAARTTLKSQDYQIVCCGVVLASGRPLPPLDAILRSHAMIHTAEGHLFREALAQAARSFDLPVIGVPERELSARGAAQLGVPPGKLQARVKEMGCDVGRPWGANEKQATLVAWLALAAGGPARVR